MLPVRRALISVSDKTGLAQFAGDLHRLGIEVLSTGGTHKFLEENGVPVLTVSEVTGFPEILDGRVKTLHPAIHGGILADRSRSGHLKQLTEHGFQPIDLVAVNLYPFRQTAATEGASFEQVVEMIDIGGPCMLRAAAKNHSSVVVVVDPEDYPQVIAALEADEGHVPEPLRRGLAIKAFRHTQAYDAAISSWLERQDGSGERPLFLRHLTQDLVRELEPRYGENPHQSAALYRTEGGPGVFGGFDQLQGKELSFNNMLDADSARRMVALFDEPAVVIVKHNNPCGVGRGEDLEEAYARALETDPTSAFGSVIAVNRPVTEGLANTMAELFIEVISAPEFEEGARARFAKKKSLRLLEGPVYQLAAGEVELRGIEGGFLAQTPDAEPEDASSWTCPTKRQPTDEERRALEFAWKVARGVKSNAIVITDENSTLGVGAGQMSRVDSCRLAVEKARRSVRGATAASDAFFPFRDGLDVLALAGVSAVVQPGGSKRDSEVVEAADEHGMTMLFTGQRHFRH